MNNPELESDPSISGDAREHSSGRKARWRSMESAPKDGTAVLLLIEGGEHSFQDDGPNATIGSFGVEGGPEEDPTWHFAGWSWHQDCYCRGSGTPAGWMPLPGEGVDQAFDQLRTERDNWKRWCAEAEATAAGNALSWTVDRWIDEVKHRPLVNVHRRTLDDTWRQVMRHFGGDPDQIVGPSHDALLAAAPRQGSNGSGEEPKSQRWQILTEGFCHVCRHDRIYGEGCARDGCPDQPKEPK